MFNHHRLIWRDTDKDKASSKKHTLYTAWSHYNMLDFSKRLMIDNRALNQYKDAVLPVLEIPLWR